MKEVIIVKGMISCDVAPVPMFYVNPDIFDPDPPHELILSAGSQDQPEGP